MHPKRPKVASVDEYIALFPEAVQAKLKELRAAIKAAAPKATEVISYSIPAYKLHGMVVYFSAYAKHVSISIPPGQTFGVFKKELEAFKYSKSTVQFPLDTPLPISLVKKMVQFKIKENMALEAAKAKK